MEIERQILVNALAALRGQMLLDKRLREHARGCKARGNPDLACSIWCVQARASIAHLRRVLFPEAGVKEVR